LGFKKPRLDFQIINGHIAISDCWVLSKLLSLSYTRTYSGRSTGSFCILTAAVAVRAQMSKFGLVHQSRSCRNPVRSISFNLSIVTCHHRAAAMLSLPRKALA